MTILTELSSSSGNDMLTGSVLGSWPGWKKIAFMPD